MDDENLSELDFEEGSDSDEEVDIRALVGKSKRKEKTSGSESSPPPKSRKT
jgi:hypothetical protein